MKLKWYNFVFYGKRLDTGMVSFVNTYSGFKYIPDMTLELIAEAREQAGVVENATFISCEKLDYMTEEEFKRNTPQEIA